MKDIQKLLSKIFTPKLFALIFLMVITFISTYVYQNPATKISTLLNSNYFVGLVTAGAGAIAFWVYFKQKADNKKDAAKTLFAEMVNAETVIKEVKNKKEYSDSGKLNLGLDPMRFYLGSFSWNQYKYLFISDFDSYEWEKINLYFSQCHTFNETIKDIASLLPKNIEYRTQFTQEVLSKIALQQAQELANLSVPENQVGEEFKKYQEEISKIAAKYKQKSDNFIVGYIEGENTPMKYIYTPVNSYAPLDRDLDKIDTEISKSSIGRKLAKLAR
ncbi:MAG: hypothetical protein WCJ58_07680 [bacterium]